MEDAMSQRHAIRQRVAPPEIDCSTPVKLADRPGLPEQYHQFEPESALAIRAALGACRPLLVRGEPGVGKTQLAAAAAKVLGRPLVQKVVESRTESRELLWEFDAVQRLAEAQIAGAVGSLILGQAPADPAAGPAGDPHEDGLQPAAYPAGVCQVRSTRPPLVGLRLGRRPAPGRAERFARPGARRRGRPEERLGGPDRRDRQGRGGLAQRPAGGARRW